MRWLELKRSFFPSTSNSGNEGGGSVGAAGEQCAWERTALELQAATLRGGAKAHDPAALCARERLEQHGLPFTTMTKTAALYFKDSPSPSSAPCALGDRSERGSSCGGGFGPAGPCAPRVSAWGVSLLLPRRGADSVDPAHFTFSRRFCCPHVCAVCAVWLLDFKISQFLGFRLFLIIYYLFISG